MKKALFCFTVMVLLAGCRTVPNVPETVTVVVEKQKPIPDWAKTPITVTRPAPATTGREHLRRESSLDALVTYVLNLANCHRRLLSELDKGASVDPKECAKP